MSDSARAASTALKPQLVKFILTVRAGPDAGATYQLLPPRATIGRGPTNDIPLSDPKCSRQQAVIEFGAVGAILRDVSDRGNLSVNGAIMKETPLRDGDQVRVGETDLVFRVQQAFPTAAPGQSLALVPPFMPSGSMAGPMAGPATGTMGGQTFGQTLGHTAGPAIGAPNSDPNDPWNASPNATYRAGPPPQDRLRETKTDNAARIRFYIIAAGIVGVLLYFAFKPTKPAAATPAIRLGKEVESDIVSAGNRVEELRKKRDMKPEERQRFLEADRHFKVGFRDLQDGYYDRAMQSFETALAIEPRHELAQFYYNRAKAKREEMISDWMTEGRRYREKNMYSRCMAALEKVIKAVPSAQDLRRRESEALRTECETLNEAD